MKKWRIRLLSALLCAVLPLTLTLAASAANSPQGYNWELKNPRSTGAVMTWLFFSDGPASDPFAYDQSGSLPIGDIRLLLVRAGGRNSEEQMVCGFRINEVIYYESTTLKDADYFDGEIEIVIGPEASSHSYDEELKKIPRDDDDGKLPIVGELSFQNGRFTGNVTVETLYMTQEQATAGQKAAQGGLRPMVAPGKYSAKDLEPIIEGIIDWKKGQNGSTPGEPLLNASFLEQAGSTSGDWYPIGLARYGYQDDYDAYLAVVKDYIEKKYKKPDKLGKYASTEWHRISLAILACGGDPTRFGIDSDGNPINLIADGVYNRGFTRSLGAQGVNGWIWGLITLDSLQYQIPSGAYYSRRELITQILNQQLPDGGFTLFPAEGSSADPDITAMAIQALAPYYRSSTFDVKSAIDRALNTLSALQLGNGGFLGWGSDNLESTAQVLVALCSLGVDPQNDQRFQKNGYSVIDGMLTFRQEDGGFCHSYDYDADNPTALPGQSNSMASEQALYALVSAWRQMKGMSPLYDFKPGGVSAGLVMPSDPSVTQSDGSDETGALLYFAPSDKQAVDELPDPLTTEQYVLVVRLIDKLERSEEFEGYNDYLIRLKNAKAEIGQVQAEIDAINTEVLEKLYPFEAITLSDKGTVDKIVARYNALSDYDQAKILRWEDVVKTKTQLDNLQRAIYIAVLLAMVAMVVAILVIRRIRARANRKQREMDELAAGYEGMDS